jgi:hypothetical protein
MQLGQAAPANMVPTSRSRSAVTRASVDAMQSVSPARLSAKKAARAAAATRSMVKPADIVTSVSKAKKHAARVAVSAQAPADKAPKSYRLKTAKSK